MIEYLTIKITQQFLDYLYTNGLDSSIIKISHYTGTKYYYSNFSTRTDFASYVQTYYKAVDFCNTGNLVKLHSVTLISSIYGITTRYIVNGICDDLSINVAYNRDVQRNTAYTAQSDRQKAWIVSAMSKYCSELLKVKKIFTTGVYSPCYAEPGYSEGTGALTGLRNSINSITNIFT